MKELVVKDVFGVDHDLDSTQPQTGMEVSWVTNEEVIRMMVADPVNHALTACVSSSYDEVVIVYGSLLGVKMSPGAAVFNSNGSIRKELEMPQLISPEYRAFEKKVGPTIAQAGLSFFNCYFKKADFEEKLIVWISFKHDFFEIREVDKTTGAFGQCLGVSRQ